VSTRFRFPEPAAAEITPQHVWQQRRQLLGAAGALALAASAPMAVAQSASPAGGRGQPLAATRNPQYAIMDRVTAYKDATTYNNFYEFGTDKADPARLAGRMPTRPWTVRVEGEVLKPRTFGIEDLLKLAPLEERVYRLRCVEGWSMVIPWIGYSLSALIKQVEPTGNAKYVQFETLADRRVMPGLSSTVLSWPYVEGLRLDEAMHPLTLLTLGMYGEVLPNQNGAPVRVVVPWKYGFKSGKSVVRIRLIEKQPVTSWVAAAPEEYGFYSNVNPEVSHPRWSQAHERRIGEDGLLSPRRRTLMFNGYAEQVASLYTGMDLKTFF
jgi:sulfoxide reductase catalytic subunit YedY